VTRWQRLLWWRAFLTANPAQQFGQPDCSMYGDGRTACMAVVLQKLARAWLNKTYTLNQISALCGRPASSTVGTLPSQVARFIVRTGLPYRVADEQSEELSFDKIANLARTRGPVGIGVKYSWHPDKRGITYRGIRADDKPNGYPLKGGRTQLDFAGSHAELVVADWTLAGIDLAWLDEQWWIVDPNHGSTVRPEKPPYDILNRRQAQQLYESRRAFGVPLLAIYPTREFVAP
jgi:hypothetical protein